MPDSVFLEGPWWVGGGEKGMANPGRDTGLENSCAMGTVQNTIMHSSSLAHVKCIATYMYMYITLVLKPIQGEICN